MLLDGDTCYRALAARDARFDGVFFVGVETTGIYCRPVCRARTPGRDRCSFYRTAAEAERASFRACFRCRPELSPGHGSVDARSRLCAAAVARIEAGFLNEASVDALAAELGVTARHLRRTMIAELGVSPVDLAQSRRLSLAKQLLQDTALPLAEVAFASGFSSVRRCNAVFQARFGRPPSALRREHGAGARRDAFTRPARLPPSARLGGAARLLRPPGHPRGGGGRGRRLPPHGAPRRPGGLDRGPARRATATRSARRSRSPWRAR